MSERFILSINEGLLKPTKDLWQTPASISAISKRGVRCHQVPPMDFRYIYLHPVPISLVIVAIQERSKQPEPPKITPREKDLKRLDLFDRKVYPTARLQMHIANCQAFLPNMTIYTGANCLSL